MIPKVLHQTSARTLTWPERRLLSQSMSVLPQWDYKLWSDDEIGSLVEELMPSRSNQFRAIRTGVIRSDIARCLFLFKHGGVYIDTDYRILKHPDTWLMQKSVFLGIEDVFGGQRLQFKLGNAFMASVPGEPLWLEYVEAIMDNLATATGNAVHISGPMALSHFLDHHPHHLAKIWVLPERWVYPPFRLGKFTTCHDEQTIGSHFCWGSWRDKSPIQRARNRIRIFGSALA